MTDWPTSFPFESPDGLTEADMHYLEAQLQKVSPELGAALADLSPISPEKITAQIQRVVTYCAGSPDGECHDCILQVVSAAASFFFASLKSGSLPDAELFAQVRELGRAQAVSGLPREAIDSAVQVASGTAWRQLSRNARIEGFTSHQLVPAINYMFTVSAFVKHQANAGYGPSELADSEPLTPHVLFETLGRNVRARREQLNMSQQAFADAAGCQRSFVEGLEQGHRSISLTSLGQWAVILQVAVDELLRD